ncbi:MAG: prepilin-type N-terminal cleavage/methylation domain-containing protein [Anaerorhabdus sp.]|uniref:prepilin-type N-terminal cleavage/methylation domain-containing protein n=1 Tax=Anaerorhabdus sp. TaxID=1872524 RepID=UPI003A8A33A5
MRRRGFTLIELIVVIAVLAVLALLLVPQITGYIEESKARTCESNRKLVERALIISKAQDEDTVITTLDELAHNNNGYYTGGKVCPDGNQNITIKGTKVSCSKHGDTTGGRPTDVPENPGVENTTSGFTIDNKFVSTVIDKDFVTAVFGKGNSWDGIDLKDGDVLYWEGRYYITHNAQSPSNSWSEQRRKEYLNNPNYCVEINLSKIYENKNDLNRGDIYKENGEYYIFFPRSSTNKDDISNYQKLKIK